MAGEIVVKDTGLGIPPDVLPHVFDCFHQGASATHPHEGTGIGLALVRAVRADDVVRGLEAAFSATATPFATSHDAHRCYPYER